MIASRVAEALPKVEVRRVEVVGARVSSELFRNGLLATGLALVAVLIYIWFRFEWQFGVGVVATLILDVTKTVGFFAITQIEFDLQLGGGAVDLERLLGHRQGRCLRPHPRESRQVSDHAVAAADRPQHQSDPRPHSGYLANRGSLDPAISIDRRRGYARLRSGYHFRHRYRHFLVDLHSFADSALSWTE